MSHQLFLLLPIHAVNKLTDSSWGELAQELDIAIPNYRVVVDTDQFLLRMLSRKNKRLRLNNAIYISRLIPFQRLSYVSKLNAALRRACLKWLYFYLKSKVGNFIFIIPYYDQVETRLYRRFPDADIYLLCSSFEKIRSNVSLLESYRYCAKNATKVFVQSNSDKRKMTIFNTKTAVLKQSYLGI